MKLQFANYSVKTSHQALQQVFSAHYYNINKTLHYFFHAHRQVFGVFRLVKISILPTAYIRIHRQHVDMDSFNFQM